MVAEAARRSGISLCPERPRLSPGARADVPGLGGDVCGRGGAVGCLGDGLDRSIVGICFGKGVFDNTGLGGNLWWLLRSYYCLYSIFFFFFFFRVNVTEQGTTEVLEIRRFFFYSGGRGPSNCLYLPFKQQDEPSTDFLEPELVPRAVVRGVGLVA